MPILVISPVCLLPRVKNKLTRLGVLAGDLDTRAPKSITVVFDNVLGTPLETAMQYLPRASSEFSVIVAWISNASGKSRLFETSLTTILRAWTMMPAMAGTSYQTGARQLWRKVKPATTAAAAAAWQRILKCR